MNFTLYCEMIENANTFKVNNGHFAGTGITQDIISEYAAEWD